MNQVMLKRDDFKVVLMALLESCAGWRGMIEEGDLPDGFTPERARATLEMYTEVSEKIRVIVEMEQIGRAHV